MIALPQKIVCVGLNYRDHADEQGVALPERPLLFAKWPNTLIGNGDPIRIPPISQQVDVTAKGGTVSFASEAMSVKPHLNKRGQAYGSYDE